MRPKICAMRQWIWTCVVVVWAGGCHIPPEEKAQMACTTVCTCTVNKLQVDECVAECVQDPDVQMITDECFDCVMGHSQDCTNFERDCEPICEPPRPQPDGPDGGTTPRDAPGL